MARYMDSLEQTNEKNLDNCVNLMNRMEKLCLDLEKSEQWGLQADAEAIKKMLYDVFNDYGLEMP